jgi:hypothetical protein
MSAAAKLHLSAKKDFSRIELSSTIPHTIFLLFAAFVVDTHVHHLEVERKCSRP